MNLAFLLVIGGGLSIVAGFVTEIAVALCLFLVPDVLYAFADLLSRLLWPHVRRLPAVGIDTSAAAPSADVWENL